MELDAAVQLLRQTTQSLKPSMESRFELCPRGYYHLNSAKGRHRLYETRQDNLTVQTIIEALDKLTPESGIDVGMNVHTHDNLRTGKLTEGMLDAVGDVGCQTHLCLYFHIRCTGQLLEPLQQLQTILTRLVAFLVVVDHVECYQFTVQSLVAHKHRQIEQVGRDIGIFHAEQNLLVIISWNFPILMGFLLNDNLLGSMFGHQGTDDTGEQDHHHHTIQHNVVDEVFTGTHFQTHTHHHHRNGTGSMG